MTKIQQGLVSNTTFKDSTKDVYKHFEVSKWNLPHLPPQFYSMGQRHASTSRLC